MDCSLTFCPYGDWPFSSLFWRTLWKSYLLSWRTKLAKLLCLKCFGRMVLVNFSHYVQGRGQSRAIATVADDTKGAHLPRGLQNYPLHHPSVQWTRRRDPPASCQLGQYMVGRLPRSATGMWFFVAGGLQVAERSPDEQRGDRADSLIQFAYLAMIRTVLAEA
jgi:hypothetical protein